MVSDATSGPSAKASGRTSTVPAFLDQAPVVAIIFAGFLAVSVPLPALSLQVAHVLGFDELIAGIVIGAQAAVTVLTRFMAGSQADRRGAKVVVLWGLALASACGLLYLTSAGLEASPILAVAVLLVGRLGMGLAESCIITGTMSWGIGRLGPERTGEVMAWQGIAMYAALGLGAPLGLALMDWGGFAAVSACAAAAPAVALVVALATRPVATVAGERTPFHRVLGLIWRAGTIQALANVPFAIMSAFIALYFTAMGWQGAGLVLTGFGVGYIAVRILFGRLPDRLAGIRVAFWSLLVQGMGQLVLWGADGSVMAVAGGVLTGLGYSLMYPSMGLEAVRRLPVADRGRAVGGFTAFIDVSLGLTAPLVGLAIAAAGAGVAFAIGGAAVLAALLLLADLWRQARRR
ncbi:MFS transporter [Zavarzinia sp. CC-PAN008]|uniref:MFS transporter n=1 Tax=Zavarzinia sp. CC-PAN008 TaxID=3243332 RepID=UPI003F744982